MKKSIAIITYCSSLDNYGQVLQAYALQRYLRDNFAEFEVKFLHAHPFAPTKPDKKPFIKQSYEKIKSAERLVRTYFHAYIMRRQKYIQRLKKQPTKPKQPAFDEKALKIHAWDEARDFANFKKAHIALHNDELQAFSGFSSEFEADIYIVGSDQIWNDGGSLNEQNAANGKHWLDLYTLNFLPPNHKSKKIAYAASFGKREFASEFEKAYFQKVLVKFDAISLRETHNIATLSKINLKSICVPDPTQLLTKRDYEKLINLSVEKGELDRAKSDDKMREKSVFVYMLGNETSMDKDEVMQFLSTKESVIYANANVDFSCAWDYKCDFAPTPQEWIACVRDCKLMITNSFHGCAFAITMQTPFVALKLGGGAEPMNTRFEQLFEIFGLQNRFVSNLNELKTIMNEPIEWDKVNAKLKAWRGVGEEFLAHNLKKL